MKYPRPASEAELSIYHLLPFLFHLFEDLYSALALQWRPLVLHHIGVRIPAGTFIAVPRRYIFKESASVMAKCFAFRSSKCLLKYHLSLAFFTSKCKQALKAKKVRGEGLLPAFVKGWWSFQWKVSLLFVFNHTHIHQKLSVMMSTFFSFSFRLFSCYPWKSPIHHYWKWRSWRIQFANYKCDPGGWCKLWVPSGTCQL